VVLRDRRLSGFKFRRQRPIDRYVVDFVCLERNLVVEIDGDTHEFTQIRDRTRTLTLEGLGYRVVRFTNDEVRRNREGVGHAILAALAEGNEDPSPHPSPASGRGGPL